MAKCSHEGAISTSSGSHVIMLTGCPCLEYTLNHTFYCLSSGSGGWGGCENIQTPKSGREKRWRCRKSSSWCGGRFQTSRLIIPRASLSGLKQYFHNSPGLCSLHSLHTENVIFLFRRYLSNDVANFGLFNFPLLLPAMLFAKLLPYSAFLGRSL